MNFKKCYFFVAVALSATSFAQESVLVAESAPSAVPLVETTADTTAANTLVSDTTAADTTAVEVVAPVAVRNGNISENLVAEPAAELADEPVVASAVLPAAVEDANAPRTVRGVSSESPAPAKKKVVYESYYIGPNGIPVRTFYVVEESVDSTSSENSLDRFPMKFRIGATASVHGYNLSTDDYNQFSYWYGESFGGFSWRAGILTLIPLNNAVGFKFGAVYEQGSASESYYINDVATHFTFEQKKIDVPAMFSFKPIGSRVFFDLGVQVGIPLDDRLKASFTEPNTGKKVKSSIDLKDERNMLDWSLVFGFSIMANDFVSLNMYADLGLSDIYDGTTDYLDLGLSSSSFGMGFSVFLF